MGFFTDLAHQGESYTPTPRDVSKEPWYWSDPVDRVDIPLPKECELYHKDGPVSPLD